MIQSVLTFEALYTVKNGTGIQAEADDTCTTNPFCLKIKTFLLIEVTAFICDITGCCEQMKC